MIYALILGCHHHVTWPVVQPGVNDPGGSSFWRVSQLARRNCLVCYWDQWQEFSSTGSLHSLQGVKTRISFFDITSEKSYAAMAFKNHFISLFNRHR